MIWLCPHSRHLLRRRLANWRQCLTCAPGAHPRRVAVHRPVVIASTDLALICLNDHQCLHRNMPRQCQRTSGVPTFPRRDTMIHLWKTSIMMNYFPLCQSIHVCYLCPHSATWKSDPKDAWTEKERTKVQEMPKSLDEPSTSVDKTKPKKASPLKEHLRPTDKPKQRRVRTRSPMPPHRKLLLQQQQKKSPCHEERPAGDERKPIALTSDESITTEQSPRKSKKIRDKGRKSPRSPTKSRKRSDSIEEKAVSLPGTLPRKKSVQRSNAQDDTTQSSAKSSRILSPRSHSPEASPTLQKPTPESGRLKALSAESLRSVSPGSDSVFYSDPSSHAAASDQHVHCLHCGKEVDIVTTDEVEKSCSQPDIVQPPEGFADSPRAKHPTSGRLFKKFEKRYRSEDRGHGDRRHFRNRSEGLRAKVRKQTIRIS